ncbi:hypothetical protein [Arsenophonus endosymbiont of Aleurodicus floccissimus]|uniref:hypothetical protein n=1 Tax=Arsenophonus endosymbiont of Aleurodicus floccissimus TaxID=2152761 RepID=UPI001EDF9839|nr:hypothetical protein [Arsenophonus endosymbiont of Aleurodicus floccissimus]
MFLHSGITIGTVIAILANLTFNKVSSTLMEETDPSVSQYVTICPYKSNKTMVIIEKNREKSGELVK